MVSATHENPGPAAPRMPVLFVGHGSPMNAVEDNRWSRGFAALAGELPRPRAILAVSAHWYVAGTFATANERPETIHDFGGFPRRAVPRRVPRARATSRSRGAPWSSPARSGRRSPPSGASTTAPGACSCTCAPRRTCRWCSSASTAASRPRSTSPSAARSPRCATRGCSSWGAATSSTTCATPSRRAGRGDAETPEWARAFDEEVARALSRHDDDALVRALASDAGRIAHPTPDHYLPLLYAAGASAPGERVRFPIVGFDMASISMRSAIFG